MIQQVGIEISATGAAGVASEFGSMARSMESFQKSMAGVNSGMERVASKMTSLSTASAGLRRATADIQAFAQQSGRALQALNTQIASTAGQLNRQMAPQQSGHGMFGGLGMWSPMRFLLPYYVAAQTLQAAKWGTKDIAMGGAREDIAKANLDMAAVSANKNQRDMIEKQAHAFSSKYGVTTAPEYIGAAAQTASAMDIQKLGAGTISTITEQNLVGSKMTNMNQAAFAEAQSKIMTSYLSRFDSSVRETLMSGGTATLPEFGRVTLPQLHAQIVAKTAKVVEKTNIWGQGLMDYYSYAGSMAGEKGMSLSDIFAMGGVMSDLGFKGAKSGRALKSILAGQAEGLANVMMVGEGKYNPNMTKDEKKAFADERRGYMAKINELSGTAEGQAQLAKMLAPGLSRSMAMAKDPNTALSLTRDLGLSQDFLPQMLALYKDGNQSKIRELSQDVARAEFADLSKKFEDVTKDTGWQLKKLSSTWNGFTSSLATAADDIFNDFSKSIGLVDKLQSMKSSLDKRNQKTLDKQFVEQIDKRPTGGKGDYSNATGEEIMALPGPMDIKGKIDAEASNRLKDRWGLAKTDEDKLKLQREAWQEGRDVWQRFWMPKEAEERHIPTDSFVRQDRPIPELGFPHDTSAPPQTRKPLFDAYGDGQDQQGSTFQWLDQYIKGTLNPQDQVSQAPPPPEPPVVNNRISVYLDGREIRAVVHEELSESKWSGDTTSAGSGFVA